MGRYNHNLVHAKSRMLADDKQGLSDGIDVEFSEALADHDDLVAQERAKAADERAKARARK